jgi:long-chain acyl-CoA synthetase
MTARGISAIAADTPDRLALVAGDDRITYADLDAAANRWANYFANQGVGHGDRVGVMLGNRPEVFACWYGAARVGAMIVPISYRFTGAEVAYLLEDSGAVAFVYEDTDLLAAVSPGSGGLRVAVTADDPAVEQSSPDTLEWDFIGSPTVFMNYTSGTTGRPKGITRARPVPSRELPAQPFAEYWGFTREDVHLLCGPAYHTAPGNYAVMHLNEGAPVVIMDRFSAEECLSLIERERVTTSHMVPANFIRILEADWATYDRSSVRKILHAAAPCPVAVKRRIMEVFPPGTIWEYFGMSEGFGTTISPEEWLAKPGSVGRPFPGLSVRIIGDDGNELGPGEVGVIYVSSFATHRFSYHNAEEKTVDAWKDDYFTVGDLGYVDEDGYLFIADRRVDLILSGGVNIYPAEIEQALAEHVDVVDSAVFGLPDDRMGQLVFALVEPRPSSGLTEEALLEHLAGRLARYKLPQRIEFVDELPREPSGKVLKRRLRDERMPHADDRPGDSGKRAGQGGERSGDGGGGSGDAVG